jgi:CUG-BP- and ETR3-like factor
MNIAIRLDEINSFLIVLFTAVPENKLFIGMLSRKAGENEVKELFEPFGEIREIYMIRNADGSSKCASFLRFVKREAAVQAIETLNNQFIMEGAARPLIVKFADNKHQRQQRQMRNVRRQEMMAAMGAGYPAYPPQVPPPMGMLPGGPQYAMAPPQFPPGPYGPPPTGTPPPPPPTHHPYMYPPHHQYGPAPPFVYPPRQEVRTTAHPRPREGPSGANLFVYHLPHDLTDADLATAFNPFGSVISAKVYVDKYTGESKGFGTFYPCPHMSTSMHVF